MIADAGSGNNNLCHIVTQDRGKRAVLRLSFTPGPQAYTRKPGQPARRNTEKFTGHRRLDAKPVPILAGFAW
jgi:hypothetical protein